MISYTMLSLITSWQLSIKFHPDKNKAPGSNEAFASE